MVTILITGSDGQLGNELKLVSKNYYGYDFIFTDLDTLDITDIHNSSDFIHKVNPDWIINCAAYNQVDKAENDEMPDFDYKPMLARFELLMTKLAVMPFDEKQLPPEDPSTF